MRNPTVDTDPRSWNIPTPCDTAHSDELGPSNCCSEREGGGSALEGDDASGTVLKVEDEHAADALVLYRTERQVVDEDHRCFAVNSVSRTRR